VPWHRSLNRATAAFAAPGWSCAAVSWQSSGKRCPFVSAAALQSGAAHHYRQSSGEGVASYETTPQGDGFGWYPASVSTMSSGFRLAHLLACEQRRAQTIGPN